MGPLRHRWPCQKLHNVFRICVNSVMSEVNIGVVSKMKKCQFVSLLPSYYAMTQPFTIMSSQVDCKSFVTLGLKQAFGCCRLSSVILIPLVLFSPPLTIIFINIF